MTEDEAIKVLKRLTLCGACTTGPCEGCERKQAKDAALSALGEIQRYRAIGTVEECREAMEKQKPMKPIHVYPMQALTGVRDTDDPGDYMCPACKTGTVFDAYGHRSVYCPYCGQKLNW